MNTTTCSRISASMQQRTPPLRTRSLTVNAQASPVTACPIAAGATVVVAAFVVGYVHGQVAK